MAQEKFSLVTLTNKTAQRANEALGSNPALKSLVALRPGQDSNSNRTTHNVVKSDNVIGLWRGTLPSLVRTVPGVGIYFTTLNAIQTKVCDKNSTPSPLEAICMGVGARSISGTLLLPVTVIKTRYESGLFDYSSIRQALKVTYTTEGVRGLFSGLTPTLLRDAPFSGLYFMFYSQLKMLLPVTTTSSSTHSKPIGTFLCGLTAGLAASLVTHPFDVVKTKMQLHRETHKNLKTALLIVYRKQGAKGFFSGLAPRMIRRSLMSALTWTIFESLLKNLQK